MADLDEPFDAAAVAEAESLDREIDAVLAGRSGPDADRTLQWITVATRVDPPRRLAEQVHAAHERERRRWWTPFRWSCAAMAYLLVAQGVSNLFLGEWVADGLREPHSPHVTRELSFALVAAGIAVAAGALRRRWAPVSAAAGAPLGIALGISGTSEIGVFAAGAALHLTQGAAAVGLAYTYWRYRRDSWAPSDE